MSNIKLIVEVDEETVKKGFDGPLTDEERQSLLRAFGNAKQFDASGDMIGRSDLINAKPEFMNEKVVRDTKYRTTKDRIYSRAWNACNAYWLDTIINAPTVEPERPKGKWIFKKFLETRTGIINSDWCPFCGMVKAQVYDNFCGNCGADMRGGKEG